jgi:hypothetical protein
MFGVTWSLLTTNCTVLPNWRRRSDCYFLYYNPNHTSLQSLTIIYYAVTRLHIYNPYTFVTTSRITYSTLALADFSAIGHFHRLSHTVAHAKSSLLTAKLSPRSHSANSLLLKHWLLHSHSGNSFLTTALVELLPKTDCLDISVLLINPQSYERQELCYVAVFTAALPQKRACCRVTSSRLRGEDLVYRPVPSNSVASSKKGLTCHNIIL